MSYDKEVYDEADRRVQVTQHVLSDVLKERMLQDKKWGEQNHDPFCYLAVLGEEYGEAVKSALQTKFGGPEAGVEKLRNELIQTAAVAVAMVECLDRGKWEWGKYEVQA